MIPESEIIFKILNNEQDTLDVLQETYLKIFTKLNQYVYKGQESFLAWTGRVASNTALDFLRRKKRDITLMGAMPFTWLIYALKQQEVTAKKQVIAAEITRKMFKNILINLENAGSTGTVTTAVSKGFAFAKMGTGKVTAIVAAGALGVGLTAGIVIGRYQSTTDSVPATENFPTTEIETTAQVSATEKKSTTEEEITEVLMELSTEQVTTEEKASEVYTTKERTEKAITTTEQYTEKKTTASTELESMEWDDDYIEWDE